MVDPIIFYIVNLSAYFNLLVNNKLITQFIIAFTFVNMSKIAIPLRGEEWIQVTCVTLDPSVENNGFEPLTPCLQSRCSSQLS